MEIGDHVYHIGVEANGIIREVDNTKRDPNRVEFQWAKYCNVKHGAWRGMKRADRKWQWCSDNMLTKLDIPINLGGLGQNKVSMIGDRSLDKLFRHMTGIPKRWYRDQSDIVINYGQSNLNIRGNPLVINENLESDKFIQQTLLSAFDLGITSKPHLDNRDNPDDWIIKPRHSMGGRDIRKYDHNLQHNEYVQRMFNKTREFRAHCFMWEKDKVPFIQEKIIKNGDQLTWNKKQGGKFRYVYQKGLTHGDFYGLDADIIARIKEASEKALKLLHYDFGGIDFGLDSTGNLRIFEINSRMGLRERSFFTYKKVFINLRTLNINEYLEEYNA